MPIGSTNLAGNTVRAQAQTSQVSSCSMRLTESRHAATGTTPEVVVTIFVPHTLTNTRVIAAKRCCLQAIEEAVNGGGSFDATRRAGVVGTTMSWAAGKE